MMVGILVAMFVLSVNFSEGCLPQSVLLFSEDHMNTTATKAVEDGEMFSVSGEIQQASQSYSEPTKIAITWFNFLEGDDIRDGTAWKWSGGLSNINASHFTLKMNLTEHQFSQNITTSLKIKNGYWKKFPEKTRQQLNNFTLAMGHIHGVYSTDDKPSTGNDRVLRDFSKGPNNEQAFADVYAVFYKRGSVDEFSFGTKTIYKECEWYSQLPQGFSCGRGASADLSCSHWERYEPVSCSEIVVKVFSRRCERNEKNLEEQNKTCFQYPNWS